MRTRRTALRVAVVMLAALAPTTTMADTINVDAMFAANGRSIWTDGPGVRLDQSGFLGPAPFDIGDTVGNVVTKCLPFTSICASVGAEIGARTSGRAGIPYGLKVDSGTFDLHYPARATFEVPTVVPGGPGSPTVTIRTSLSAVPGGLGLPDLPGGPVTLRTATLQVRSPDLQAFVDLAAEFHAFAGGRACLGVCYPFNPTLGPIDFNESKEIAAINRGGDGEIRVLGETYSSHQSISEFNGLLNASFNLPRLDSSSADTRGGFDGVNLTSSGRDSVAVLNANIAQIVLTAVGLGIPLSGNLGPIGYNLLQVNAGAFINVEQTLTFTPSATARLLFSSEVVPRIGGVDQAPTRVIDIRLGDDVTFTPLGLAAVGVEPIISFGGQIRNSFDLVLGGHVDVKALGVNVAGLTLGPLVDESLSSDQVGTLNLLTNEFDTRLGTVMGRGFNLSFPDCVQRFGSGELSVPEGECAISGFGGGASFMDSAGFLEDELSVF
ncbi:MAG TPA: hypothetical protein VML54_12070, partial [Candidatus Limnocylindrales bacterium]|nr:hypothetical protein [Candidatus Limnocylindrales bacterium]